MSWACSACTYENVAAASRCEMCETPRHGTLDAQRLQQNEQQARLARQQQHAEQALAGVAGAIFGGILGAAHAAEQQTQQARRPGGRAVRNSETLGSVLGGAISGALLGATAASTAASMASAAARPADSSSGASSVDGADRVGGADPANSAGAAPGGPNAARRDGSHQVPTSATSMADLYSLFRAMMAPPGQLATQPQDTVAARREAVAAQRQAAATRSLEEIMGGLEQMRQMFVESMGGSQNVPAVAPASAIDALPERFYERGDRIDGGVEEEDGEVSCVICLDALKPGDILKELPCRHACFHSRCISAWLSRGAGACPVCRREVR